MKALRSSAGLLARRKLGKAGRLQTNLTKNLTLLILKNYKMRYLYLFLISLIIPFNMNSQHEDFKTVFEKNNQQTATYAETIDYYKSIASRFKNLKINEAGSTDSGYPLHEVILSASGHFDPKSARDAGKLVLFINNAIHPGEPCGVDASMLLVRDLLTSKTSVFEDIVLVIIPFYNIGGGLNRGAYSRANQNGPEEYGFRGNAKNLDLNRDFIKCDSENAHSFAKLYTKWMPDVFIDNHTSNGADYQYTMTMICTQADKLGGPMKDYLNESLEPMLYQKMKEKQWEMTPYVYARTTPDDGIAGFLDLPRYSSGYAALHHAYSFIPEAHMLKPYKDRVLSIYAFMESMLETMEENKAAIHQSIKDAAALMQTKITFDLNWKLDNEKHEEFLFKGYEAKYKPSLISGKDRLYYDQNAPYEKNIKFFKFYNPTVTVEKPIAYLIPQAYKNIIRLLELNGVEVETLETDQVFDLEKYRIVDFETVKKPYEGHYLHYDVKVEKFNVRQSYYKGDFMVSTNQDAVRFILETLEPQAADSYFAWNYFDSVLQQKEHFSDYVFEDLAVELLNENENIKKAFEDKKASDEAFAKDGRAQLDFIYKMSLHYEPTVNVYPVGRVVGDR